jgi:hypothetical protein
VIALLIGGAAAHADTLVIPSAYANVDAPTEVAYPFAVGQFSNRPYRYQQVYDATGFGSPGDVIAISAVSFRIDQGTGDAAPFVVQDVDVHLSTTTKAVNGLSGGSTEALDSNVGPDARLLFTGMLNWDPCGSNDCVFDPFDLTITFPHPFAYDPTTGNLLLEVFNFSTPPFPNNFFDAVQNDASTSNTRDMIDVADGVTHHFFTDPVGLVTQFTFTVPEPGAIGSVASALLALAGLKRRRV